MNPSNSDQSGAAIPSGFQGFSFPKNLSETFPEHALLIADIIALWNLLEDKCINLIEVFTGIDFAQADLMVSQLASPKAKMDTVR